MGRQCDAWCAELERVQEPGIRVLPGVWPDVDREMVVAFSAAVEPMGYVIVDAHRDLPEPARRAFWHRHVVLIHRGAATPVSVRWIRELSQASPRAHRVLLVAEWPDRARETAPGLRATLPLPPPGGRASQARRADRFHQRHRRMAAQRWTGAALESARRVCDDSGAASAFVRLAELVDIADARAVEGLVSRGRRLLAGVHQLGARSHVTGVMADLCFTLGEFEAAAAALAAVDVECEIVRAEVPAWIRTRQCELACWRGR
jgi:hypothetical protein